MSASVQCRLFLDVTRLMTEVRTETRCDRWDVVSMLRVQQDRTLTGEKPKLIGHRKVPILRGPVRKANLKQTVKSYDNEKPERCPKINRTEGSFPMVYSLHDFCPDHAYFIFNDTWLSGESMVHDSINEPRPPRLIDSRRTESRTKQSSNTRR